MAILVTGASGFVGQAFVPKLLARGHKVYALSRHPPIGSKNLIPLVGDITEPGLGLGSVPGDIESVHHIAGNHSLGVDKDGSIHKTNVEGTRNVVAFCARYNIPRLYYTSTAYTQGRNPYERSKALCELLVTGSDIPKVTIFKPSIIMGTDENPNPGHFSLFASLVIKIHQRAEKIRRKVEETLRLPVLEPVFRIKGNPKGKLNLISIDDVTNAMLSLEGRTSYYLTNPNPPTLGQLLEWISDYVMATAKFVPEFKPTPLERQFRKMASVFGPYLQGDDFRSDLQYCRPITREFIHDTITRSI